jgi:hypothetical protein
MNRIRNTFLLIVLLFLGGLAAYYRFFWRDPHHRITRVLDSPSVLEQIQQLQELTTVKYSLQKVIGLEEEKVPFGSESVMMVVQAHVKAGVDLRELLPHDIVVENHTKIILRLPAAKILDVYIDDKLTRVYQRTKTWWTPWVSPNPQLEQQARQAALEAVQVAAIQSGILSNAQANAETALRAFLKSTGFESVSFAPGR